VLQIIPNHTEKVFPELIIYLFLELFPAVIPILVIVRSSQKQGIFPSTCLPAGRSGLGICGINSI
jgi:hypothetical protein